MPTLWLPRAAARDRSLLPPTGRGARRRRFTPRTLSRGPRGPESESPRLGFPGGTTPLARPWSPGALEPWPPGTQRRRFRPASPSRASGPGVRRGTLPSAREPRAAPGRVVPSLPGACPPRKGLQRPRCCGGRGRVTPGARAPYPGTGSRRSPDESFQAGRYLSEVLTIREGFIFIFFKLGILILFIPPSLPK